MSIQVPSNPTDLKKLFDGVKELTDSMIRQESEKEFQKEALTTLTEESGVPKADIKRMASDYHKDTFKKNVEKYEDYQELYEATIQAGTRNLSDDEDEDE